MKLGFGLIAFAAASKQYIIGGYEPSPNTEKYIVSLQRGGSHFCGGTVISSSKFSISAIHNITIRILKFPKYTGPSKLQTTIPDLGLDRLSLDQTHGPDENFGPPYHFNRFSNLVRSAHSLIRELQSLH